ncbi:hypothetical protein P3X46_033812 [Hevea brasiliensis]|uniref:RING-type E3 ubiquitin transferase n=1 Tax=Hevea brasiliensis TaxID=3981 RepID=A0ABQ9KAK4_HEVBR|nr:RING-H2 finger protein ATL73-like [Hevea brasiliensis]KAJ9131046.1 hypothetical protein P3X46_033812 [Hevea brasiliensis]
MAQISPSPTLSAQEPPQLPPATSADFNIMVIIAAMLCALVCALGLNSMLHCVFQCTRRAITETVEWVVSRRHNTGLKKKEMVALPTSTYSDDQSSSSPSTASASGCAICLADFANGDKLRNLPKCNHRFHVVCIDKWLISNSSCPTCRDKLHSLPSLDQIVTSL